MGAGMSERGTRSVPSGRRIDLRYSAWPTGCWGAWPMPRTWPRTCGCGRPERICEKVDDLRAWLVTVAARRSYDILKSARSAARPMSGRGCRNRC